MPAQNIAPLTRADRDAALDARVDRTDGEVHLTGVQALVRLPLDQRRLDDRRGLNSSVFISGYEGSPLAGLDLQLGRQKKRHEQNRIVFKPGLNEELAANAVQGSQLASVSPDRVGDGVVGIWYGKAPGLDRATDAIRHNNLGGTHHHGGVLALVGDDSLAKSSTVPSSSEVAIAELGMPCLSPSNPQDVLDFGLHGIAMSRACGLWVAMKIATNVADGSGTVKVHPDRIVPIEPDRTFDGQTFTHTVTAHFLQPMLAKLEHSQTHERIELARRYAAANGLDVIVGDPTARIGIVAAGATYQDTRQALAELGITEANIASSGVRVLKLGMINPLEPGILDRFAAGLDEIVVVEEKKPFLELGLKDHFYGVAGAPPIYGKRDAAGQELFRADNDLPADYIAARLAPRISDHGGADSAAAWIEAQKSARRVPTMLPILPRTPYFCSGCPHNRSTRVPEGSLVGAGIGCHGLTVLYPEERVGSTIGLTAMGGEGVAWIGMSPFVTADHLFQNLGDGTFHHSGSLAVRASIAGGANITYKLLYNDTVAMTGGQDPVGQMKVPQIVKELLAEGVKQIVVTAPDPRTARHQFGRRPLPRNVSIRHRDDLFTVQEELAKVPGVTVLIHQQECATELRRKRKRGLVATPKQRIMINERVCEGCGDCGAKSNCLSVRPVETEFGRKTQIHQGSCNLDFSCANGDCPSFVEVIPARSAKKKASSSSATKITGSTRKPRLISLDDLPTPVKRVGVEDFTMRITGVGGTGVVTVAQSLAAAASRAGLNAAGLDQLGIAQKGGAVVSDVRFSRGPIVGSNKIAPGGCDLYLGCDILVASTQQNLAVIAPERTYAIVSTSMTPTGRMVTDTHTEFPSQGELRERIEWAGARDENVFVDARAHLGELGEDQYANVFLLGVAVQAGVLPLAPEDIEWAFDLNGVQVERNVQAFRLGRQYAASGGAAPAEPVRRRVRVADASAREVAARVSAPTGSVLAEVVLRRVEELIAYQNVGYARRYAGHVEHIRAAESATLGGATSISEEYARQLFKLMAYKDEYEVARLQVDPAFEKQLRAEFGEGARYSILLHPPILRAMGMKRKIKLQSWWGKPFLQLLYLMRGVRGTAFDIFGYAGMRKTERALIHEYVDAMDAAVASLTTETQPLVHDLAALPEWIRGYEDIKMHSVDDFRTRRSELITLIGHPAGR